jgi:hypothetical protein
VYGTPYTEALHVVERYRLIDYEAAKEAYPSGEGPALFVDSAPIYVIGGDYAASFSW